MGEIGGGREGEIFGLREVRSLWGGRADGLHRPIERFRLEWLSDPIG